MKSFRPKDWDTPLSGEGGRNPEVDFRGEPRADETRASTTDRHAGLARKGRGREARSSRDAARLRRYLRISSRTGLLPHHLPSSTINVPVNPCISLRIVNSPVLSGVKSNDVISLRFTLISSAT